MTTAYQSLMQQQRNAEPFGAVATRADADLADYRAALAAFDWSFEMSDDSTVWRAGVASLKALHELQAHVDPMGSIWRQHLDSLGRTTPGPRVGVFAA